VTSAVQVVSTTGATEWECSVSMSVEDTAGAVGFTIDATDLAGNAMVQVTTVGDTSSVTFDNVAPTLTTVSIASDSATTDLTLAKTGDTVTVLMEASEAIAEPTCAFTVGGEAATGSAVVVADTSSGARTGWSCVYELVAGDSEGVVEFTISSAGDNAGNPLDTVQSVTAEGGIVVFDRTSPTLSVDSVVVSSVGLAASQAGVDDVVALEFTTSEALGAEPTCAVAVGGTSTQGVVSVSDTSSGAGTAWLCDVVLSAQDGPGAIMFSIDGLDASGNDMSQVQRTVTTCTGTHSDGSNCDSTVAFVSSGLVADCPTTNDCVFNTIAFDNAAPVLSAVTIASDNSVTTLAKTGDTLTLAFTADAEITVQRVRSQLVV